MATLKSSIFLALLFIITLPSLARQSGNIEFIENKGQWDERVKFEAKLDAGTIYIREEGFTVVQHDRDTWIHLLQTTMKHGVGTAVKSAPAGSDNESITLKSHSWNVDFVDASPQMKIIPDKMIVTYNNYFIGDDPSKWASNCRIFQAITFQDVYPGVDVRYYTHNGNLKYDIIAKPGADISKIALRYEGADKLAIKNKELVVSTSIGEFREAKPYTYQPDPVRGRREVKTEYVVNGNIVRFNISNYDRNQTLVIDPSLIFCTYSGSGAQNWGFSSTYGPDGSFYGGGIVFGDSPNGFPASPGAFQSTYQGGEAVGSVGGHDIGIMRLSPDGVSRIYATYIGGSGNEQPHSLIADGEGNLIIAGRSNSTGNAVRKYPTTGPTIGAGGGFDIIITKLNATGTALIGSRLIGGTGNDGANINSTRNGASSLQQNYGDDGRSEVILDGAGNIYVASCTQSGDFPVFNAFQTASGGKQDAVVIKMDPNVAGANPLFSSYLGGSENDAGYVLSLAPNGDILVAGGTESSDFPGPKGAVGNTFGGNIDGYIARISNNGAALIQSAFIGTAGIDQIYGIQFDRNGFLYVMGQTTGSMPAINIPAGGFYQNNGKIFISKLQPDLSGYVYRTAFGTGGAYPNISPTAFLVDRCENVYVSGWGTTTESMKAGYNTAGTIGLTVTPDALKPTTDGDDFYFMVIRRDAAGPGPLYASFFGQNGGYADHVDGGTSRFDRNGVIYQTVCASCWGGNFPTTPGSWSPFKTTELCNMAMFKLAFNLAGVTSQIRSEINGVVNDTAGCVPLDITFTDLIRMAQQYIWDFGDGSPQVGPLPADTGYTQTHTYTSVGTYRVMLIAIDPASCNERDTSYMNVRVGDLRATLQANVVKLDPCESFNYRFDNLSTTLPVRPFTDTSFIWDFGDGTPRVVGGLNSVTHSYANPGTYNAKLILNDTAYCNNPDSIEIVVRVSADVEAAFTGPASGCSPLDAGFVYTGMGGQTFEWNFGDPASGADNTSSLANPTHVFSNPGTYTVQLVVIDPNTCNVTDTARQTIVVTDGPVADFNFTPTTPVENTPHVFTNLTTTNATRFIWDFGDGTRVETTSRGPQTHQYTSTGTYNSCLIAFNDLGCSDTICKPVSAIVSPLLDVPNAFTPNSGDINSVIKVRGYGIVKMKFIIWNRWGQKVFETSNPDEGWDGKVKGQLQPMDVYAYTLEAEFFDGSKATKKGDITLIR